MKFDTKLKDKSTSNPYANINWNSVKKIPSATHMHIPSQKILDNGYKYGIRHFPISNYYPSAPHNENTRESDFKLHQHWPAKRKDGNDIEPPVNWNELITWQEELNEPFRSNLPFQEEDLLFTNVPNDIIFSPNAEHHGFTNSHAHICSPGSNLITGNIDPQGNKYNLDKHGFVIGFGDTWEKAFELMIQELKFPDAGGITINHPTWFSKLKESQVFEMLDFDNRVLGIEIYNDYSGRKNWFENPNYQAPDEKTPGYSTNLWNKILSTGRKCWGFSVPDHSVELGKDWIGRNILLVSEFTDHECLKAYRNGNFYGCLKDNGLHIINFSVTDSEITVKTNRKATFKFITEKGIATQAQGDHSTFQLPKENGQTDLIFVRLEISDETGECLFLQPIMYTS